MEVIAVGKAEGVGRERDESRLCVHLATHREYGHGKARSRLSERSSGEMMMGLPRRLSDLRPFGDDGLDLGAEVGGVLADKMSDHELVGQDMDLAPSQHEAVDAVANLRWEP